MGISERKELGKAGNADLIQMSLQKFIGEGYDKTFLSKKDCRTK